MKTLTTVVAWVIAMVILLATAAPLGAYATQSLWGWFFVPLGLPALGFWHAMGIDMAVTFVASGGPPRDDEKGADLLRIKHFAMNAYLRPVAALALGHIVHRLMVAA